MNKMKTFVVCSLVAGSMLAIACVGATDSASIGPESDGVAQSAFGNPRLTNHMDHRNDGDEGKKRAQGVSSPYVAGEWKFAQQDCSGTTKVIADTEFRFINPTPLTLALEYAFFDIDGNFCGCDIDTLAPNATVPYTMAQERAGGQFSLTLCPTARSGALKAIVFNGTSNGNPVLDDTLQVGFQTFAFDRDGVEEPQADDDFLRGRTMTEAPLQGIAINGVTIQEINHIHQLCAGFTPVPPGT